MTRAILLALNLGLILGAQDATEIIRQSVDRDATNFERFKNYTFLERVEERRYGRTGNLSSSEIQTYEFMVLGGRPYGKLVERNDKPLPAKEARKEQEKVDKESAKRQRESASALSPAPVAARSTGNARYSSTQTRRQRSNCRQNFLR